MGKLIDITGQKFGRLTALKRVKNDKQNCVCYLCKCDCGKEVIVRSSSLKNGNTQSCGCLQKQTAIITSKNNFTKHNLSNHRIYRIYRGIKNRCYNKNEKAFINYGGRGILICEEWRNNFENFYNWAINNGYDDNLTIDRIDVNGDYCPENCRWANRIQQANNKSNNTKIKYNNEEHTLAEWARILGYSYSTMRHRYYRNWDVEKMMQQPQRRTLCK